MREGGALLMAATYDGDGNRVFQLHRTVVPTGDGLNPVDAKNAKDDRREITAPDILAPVVSTFTGPTPGVYHYEEKVYENDFIDHSFWYGFGSMLVSAACIPDSACLFAAQRDYNAAWNEFLERFVLETRYDRREDFSGEDLAALARAGLDDADIRSVTEPAAAPAGLDTTVLIPKNDGAKTRYDYELTYYVNDLSYENAQVASEYGKRGEAKRSYTYGAERLAATDVGGKVDTYLYDGRDSVAQVLCVPAGTQAGAQTVRSLTYDPYGAITSEIDPYTPVFAHNAEEYNPVTHLQYLRARYYAPETANFITRDDVLGRTDSVNSQNRYAFAESDPVNNADPTGHAIGKTSYERQMEGAGGINEIYNFYVGTTLQNSYNAASSAFYSKLNYAYGVDYTSQAAINSITGISQATANLYIEAGAAAAMAAGRSWGCTPGDLTRTAIVGFAANVNATRTSVNTRIGQVRANKQAQYNQYQAYLAYLAYAAEQARRQEELGAARSSARDAKVRAKQAANQVNAAARQVLGVFTGAIGSALGKGSWTVPVPQPVVSTVSLPFQYEPYLYGSFLYEPFDPSTTDWGSLGHTALDGFGMIPVVGEPVDAINGTWYAAEGDWVNAGLSFAAVVPIGGWAATGAKAGIKVGKEVVKGGETAAELGVKGAKSADGFDILSGKTLTDQTKKGVDNYVSPDKGHEAAQADFDAMTMTNVRTYSNGTVAGDLPDGRTVNLHSSTALKGTPSVEIYNPISGNSIKIRY